MIPSLLPTVTWGNTNYQKLLCIAGKKYLSCHTGECRWVIFVLAGIPEMPRDARAHVGGFTAAKARQERINLECR